MIFLLLEYSTYDFEVRPIEQRFPVVLNVLIFYLLFDNYHIMNKEIQQLVKLEEEEEEEEDDNVNVECNHLNNEN